MILLCILNTQSCVITIGCEDISPIQSCVITLGCEDISPIYSCVITLGCEDISTIQSTTLGREDISPIQSSVNAPAATPIPMFINLSGDIFNL